MPNLIAVCQTRERESKQAGELQVAMPRSTHAIARALTRGGSACLRV